MSLTSRRIVRPALKLLLIAGLYLAGEEDAFGRAWVVVAIVMIGVLMAMHRLGLMRGYAQLAAGALVLVTIYVLTAKRFV